MSEFEQHWNFLLDRRNRFSFPIVQDHAEMEHVYNLAIGCKSYLEVGTAEGNSLYIMSQALSSDALIVYIDLAEPHTRDAREEVLNLMTQRVIECPCNSHSDSAINIAASHQKYDIVLIDAGHTYEDVIADAMVYGRLASKYIIFHDIMMPGVRWAFDWYCRSQKFPDVRFIASPDSNFGYGIVTL